MKKLSLFMLAVIFIFALFACEDASTDESQASVESQVQESEASSKESADSQAESDVESSAESDPDAILTAEEMIEIEEITAVTKNEQYSRSDAYVYNIEFVSDGLKLNAQLALPANYEANNYPTVIYLPDIGYDEGFLIENFAYKKVNVIRLFSRGAKGNEGMKDVCGEDFSDTELILKFCRESDFLSRGGIAVAGSSEGSIHALKLAAKHSSELIGCVVSQTLCDIEKACEEREQSKQFFEYFLGGSFDEVPEEYKKRSAIYYADEIKVPVLIICYKDTEERPTKYQAEALKSALDAAGGNGEIYNIDVSYSDFNGTAFMKFIPWIKALAEAK